MRTRRAGLTICCAQQVGADQEVRAPQQRRPTHGLLLQQHTLVDHLGAGADSFQGGSRPVGTRPVTNLLDVTSRGAEPVQHGPLVSLAPRHEVLKASVERAGRAEDPPRPQQVQPGQMLTRQKIRYIGRGQPKPVTGDLHRTSSSE